MVSPQLIRVERHGVTLLSDTNRSSRVAFGFTERTGGVSQAPYASLNLGSRVGDDASCVVENRRRALAALGADAWEDALVCPHQVHGDRIVVLDCAGTDALNIAQTQAEEGADAVVCTVSKVPVLLCFADCVPVILSCASGFAVVHSGWRGTLARIAAKAALSLAQTAAVSPSDICAYLGPHIGVGDYEVSPELAERFVAEFGEEVSQLGNHLDLAYAVRFALEQVGVLGHHIACCDLSTASATERFYSYRAEGPTSGRHGALAVLKAA